VSIATPVWDEPYGLVVAESMACGTPVAGFARGALPELVGQSGGVLAPPNDVEALAMAILAAQNLDRRLVRAHAANTCSAEMMCVATSAYTKTSSAADGMIGYYVTIKGPAICAECRDCPPSQDIDDGALFDSTYRWS